jgi:hypothetical protein
MNIYNQYRILEVIHEVIRKYKGRGFDAFYE